MRNSYPSGHFRFEQRQDTNAKYRLTFIAGSDSKLVNFKSTFNLGNDFGELTK